MRKLNKKKKGISLLEIVISIAILAIISIPISAMILTSVKTNKNSEDKQKAALLGQQILEEIRSQKIDINYDKFELSNNIKLEKVFNEDTSKYGFITTNINDEYGGLKADVKLNQISYSGLDQDEEKIKYDEEINIDKVESDFIVTIDGDKTLINSSGKIKLLITNYNENIQVVIQSISPGATSNLKTYYTDKSIDNKSGYIKMNINHSDLYSNLLIEVINNRNDSMVVYLDNSNTRDKDTKDIIIENTIGSIKRINNITTINNILEQRKGTMFEVSVVISKDSTRLFEGNSIKNIYIN